MLHAHYEPTEAEDVKAGLLAWFCDELQDWTHEQVVLAIRSWNRENPRRRPTPGDLVAILKRLRGEAHAKRVAALPKPAEAARELPSLERRAEMLAEAHRLIGGIGK